jgi:hypothetical protein
MALPGASLVGGDERVYHDNNALPRGAADPGGPADRRGGKGLEAVPHVRGARGEVEVGLAAPSSAPPSPHHPM